MSSLKSVAMTVASFATNSHKLYSDAIDFYKSLGFDLVAELGPNDTSASFRRAAEATKNAALILPSEKAGQEASVNLQLTARGIDPEKQREARDHLFENVEKCDWRSVAPVHYFSVEDISGFPADFPSPVQKLPPIGSFEVYAVDPLGNLICFTQSTNAVSNKLPQKPVVPVVKTMPGNILPSDLDAPGAEASPKDSNVRKRIAVLTSGGDAPGMNACVRSVVRTAIHNSCEAFVVYDGYEGLIHGGDHIKQMQWDDVRGFVGIGGTLIGSARSQGFRERDGRKTACLNMCNHGIDGLVVCGGDGSLTGADKFRHEWPELIKELLDERKISQKQYDSYKHLNIAGTVGSIDNDMAMTDVTIGAYSSLERICTNVDWISATAESHARAFVVEVMGRHCGWLALMAAIACNADYMFIPELPPPGEDWSSQMNEIVLRHRAAGRRRSIVIVAEGAIDSHLKPIKADMVKDKLSAIGLDTRVTTLGHVQRGGNAVAIDRLLGTMQGAAAVDAILKATPTTPSPMIGIKENKIVSVNLVDAVANTKKVAEAISKKDFDTARSLRDAEFHDHLHNYLKLSGSDRVSKNNRAEKLLNIAIIAIGAPAGGMNAAVSAATRYCFSRGHKAYYIFNGWTGLARHESVREASWLGAEAMFTEGGCEIGTNRNLPDVDIGMIAYYFGKYAFDGLILVGGFEAYNSLHMLEHYRNSYPAFRIPMVCIPATISNNVPGTEHSLGTDTCVNMLVEYCDIVKQSAASTRRRVFVVEVQGGRSGYIASYTGLVCGAHAVYTPEDGISLSQLSADIKHLRDCFKNDQGRVRAGRLVIRNEKSAQGFSTENLASIFETESHGHYDCREAIPGHLQQGGSPSPIDRVRATRLAVRSVQFIEKHHGFDFKHPEARDESAVVIGVNSAKLEYTPVNFLWEYETESSMRRPKTIHWQSMLDMSNVMTRRPIVTLKDKSSSSTDTHLGH